MSYFEFKGPHFMAETSIILRKLLRMRPLGTDSIQGRLAMEADLLKAHLRKGISPEIILYQGGFSTPNRTTNKGKTTGELFKTRKNVVGGNST